MCGIAGQVTLRPSRSPSQDQVLAMLRAMIHRGPDDEGVFADPTRRAVIGIRRLSIIDLVSGRQPIFNEDHSVACVLNGEIYNFLELRADLERRGHSFRTNSDTEAIVHLYEEEGVRCLQRLRGMFALAVWDARTGTLLVARDRLGKKPVYYTDTGGRLSFASELPVLRQLPDLARDLDS